MRFGMSLPGDGGSNRILRKKGGFCSLFSNLAIKILVYRKALTSEREALSPFAVLPVTVYSTHGWSLYESVGLFRITCTI